MKSTPVTTAPPKPKPEEPKQEERKMEIVNASPGSLVDPAVWDRANREARAVAKRLSSTTAARADYDLPQLKFMLSVIDERRRDATRHLAEATTELDGLETRESAAREVLATFAERASWDARVAVSEANDALEKIEEQRVNARRRKQEATNLLADADRRDREFPRDLYEQLVREDRTLDAMRAR